MVGWAVCGLLCLPLRQGGHGLSLGPQSPGSFLTCPSPARLGRPDSWTRLWAGSPSWGARYEVLCMVLVSCFRGSTSFPHYARPFESSGQRSVSLKKWGRKHGRTSFPR